MITVALVENNPRHLDVTANYLKSNPNYKLLTTATNGFEMLQYCYSSKHLPQIVLIDIEMKVMDGISLMDFLRKFYPEIKCIALTNHHHLEMFEDAMCCGALGLVLKEFTMPDPKNIMGENWHKTKFDGLDACIATVAAGEFYIEAKMKILAKEFLHLLDRQAMLHKRQQEINANDAFNLTDKQLEIAMLCASTTESIRNIAILLNMSLKKLEPKLTEIYKQFAVSSRIELVRLCSSKAIVKTCREILGREIMN